MRYVKFKMITDEEFTGEPGILANIHQNWEGYVPSQPTGMGHDLLEHSINEHGYFYEEMAALGGFLFVRNFGIQRQSYLTPLSNTLAYDIVSSSNNNSEIIPAPKFKLLSTEISEIDALLLETRPKVIESWTYEYSYDNEKGNFFKDDDTWKAICDWVKYGFARAKRRFKNDRDTAYALFQSIEQTLQREWKNLLNYTGSGKEFTLQLDYDNGYASLGDY